ncbi:MAG: helix-turn-helix domain-containing protein [Campylobacteraceae bacterium]|nr:helix-turn-helix domain-containing protein [Campylobacteraceae bacterium]
MEVWEKINYLIAEQKMSKLEFARKLVELEPRLRLTGETPSPQTILGYLYGKREIKVELIPYIAEVLGVSEQELFTFDLEYSTGYNHRHSKEVREIIHLLPYAPQSVVAHIKEQLSKYKKLHDETVRQF